MSPNIYLKVLSTTAILPTKAFDGDAGFDVYSDSPTFTLSFGERYKVKLGFAMELNPGWVALIQEKSGMAVNSGILTIGNVIDSNYRGEVHAVICCMGQKLVVIARGQKVAQMLIMPCYTGKKYKVVSDLLDSNRGKGGFGSTGLEGLC